MNADRGILRAYRNSPTLFRAVPLEQKPIKFCGKVTMGVVRESRKFSGHPYMWRTARSYHSFLVFEILSSTKRQLSVMQAVVNNQWQLSCFWNTIEHKTTVICDAGGRQ